jgi:hypothetical protein
MVRNYETELSSIEQLISYMAIKKSLTSADLPYQENNRLRLVLQITMGTKSQMDTDACKKIIDIFKKFAIAEKSKDYCCLLSVDLDHDFIQNVSQFQFT